MYGVSFFHNAKLNKILRMTNQIHWLSLIFSTRDIHIQFPNCLDFYKNQQFNSLDFYKKRPFNCLDFYKILIQLFDTSIIIIIFASVITQYNISILVPLSDVRSKTLDNLNIWTTKLQMRVERSTYILFMPFQI